MEGAGEESPEDNTNNDTNTAASRKERRKAAKKEKRKKLRKEMAELARLNEEARLNDPEEQLRLQAEEEQERLRIEKERRDFEEKERKIMEEWEKRKAAEQREEEERRRQAEEDEHRSKQNQVGDGDEVDDDGWEYVEEGPPEIIWQGNEIIVKKKRIRVKKKDAELQIMKEDRNRPTSNPLPPQSEVFADYKDASSLSAQQLLENVAQETPNFGTEQDKAHCPFHLKTGACRFGSRCARIHFYPDKSCTLLIKNMYNGPGLAWEQDEGLEYTDEDVEHAYEEFYEDVHTEFLKFGEIVNFKVCRNGSSHLRGNVYVHYKSLDSAVLSYQSVNGRYFAGKQLQCEFVGVTRWKVAICGEFMKSRLQTCSRGMSCNFIHCFRNPGGDYEWADWDKPPPKYWLKKMASLFGYSDELVHDKEIEQGSPRLFRNSRRTLTGDADRSQSRENGSSRSSRNNSKDDVRTSGPRQRHRRTTDRKQSEELNDKQFCHSSNSREKQHRHSSIDRDSDRYWLERNGGRHSSHGSINLFPACSKGKLGSQDGKGNEMNIHENNHEENTDKFYHHRRSRSSTRHKEKSIHRREESPSSDGSDEIELKSSKRQCTRRGRRSGEVEHDSESPSYSGRGHRNSESDSNHHSQTDGYQSERGEPGKQFHHHLKNSERKTDTSRIDFHKPLRSHATENVMEEDTDDRGRWEPEKGGDLSE